MMHTKGLMNIVVGEIGPKYIILVMTDNGASIKRDG